LQKRLASAGRSVLLENEMKQDEGVEETMEKARLLFFGDHGILWPCTKEGLWTASMDTMPAIPIDAENSWIYAIDIPRVDKEWRVPVALLYKACKRFPIRWKRVSHNGGFYPTSEECESATT